MGNGRIEPPRHIAIIMDGNGRWATRRGLPRAEGHAAGTENIRPIIRACPPLGVSHLTLYAFSTENWSRPEEEVQALMQILSQVIQRETAELHRNNVRLRHIGRLEGLSADLRAAIVDAIDLTGGNTGLNVTLAFNYGGRDELVRAVRRLVIDGLPHDEISEQLVSGYLDSADLPDPDLIIRTAGEQRLSNFLIWQAAYAEYWFTPVLWPDFGPTDLEEAVAAFVNRERKFGRLAEV
ncbi:MAG: di-trans,poly-cis-decaprenylcistransferase [Chloroflexi bacterium]|nr:di-trans,poly-cis-decaprenylcistransferase [Chloroflexota bacterium]